MSKTLTITFNSQPTPTTAFNYMITVFSKPIIYDGGKINVNFSYQPLGGGDPNKLEIQSTLDGTIDATLAYLNANYSSSEIIYARVGNTITVTVNVTWPVLFYIIDSNPSIVLTEGAAPVVSYGLKYFLQYKNLVNDDYRCEIFNKNYSGTSTEIHGKAIIEKANVNNLLDPIRGGGVQLQLEASKDLNLEDLYSENEQDFKITIYKNNKVVFQGYLNPDGVYQDYVRDEWIITLDCVDGLGALSNLSFVQENGLHFTGKMKAIDIIYNCLKRTGILMPINTSINIRYDGLPITDDVLSNIYLNTERFTKTDKETIMSCEDVLKSILDIFKACITQQDGEWYIYKPNEIYIEPYVVFRKFDINNVFLNNVTVNLNKALGSQIDSFYPHHCTGNQRIEIKGAVASFRMGYKYGLVSGLFENPNLIKTGNDLIYDGWTVDNNTTFGSVLLNDPLDNHGFLFSGAPGLLEFNEIVKSDPISVAIDDDLSLKLSFDVHSTFGSTFVKFHIQQGIYHLDYAPKNSQTPIEDTANATWSTDSSKRFVIYLANKVGTFTIALPKILSDGNMTVSILAVQGSGTTTFIDSLDIIPTQNAGAPEGEFHTVARKSKVSSNVKANQTVYNGDNPSSVYTGTIFNKDLNATTLWLRKNSADKLPLLQIAAEEELRIAQKPTKRFIGDFYGYIPYLSLITINNIGKFMPIEWSYDTATNVTTCKQLELFVAEINDVDYKYTLDYGQTVKPTIK